MKQTQIDENHDYICDICGIKFSEPEDIESITEETSPQTGDDGLIVWYFVAEIVSLIGVIVCFRRRKNYTV